MGERMSGSGEGLLFVFRFGIICGVGIFQYGCGACPEDDIIMEIHAPCASHLMWRSSMAKHARVAISWMILRPICPRPSLLFYDSSCKRDSLVVIAISRLLPWIVVRLLHLLQKSLLLFRRNLHGRSGIQPNIEPHEPQHNRHAHLRNTTVRGGERR